MSYSCEWFAPSITGSQVPQAWGHQSCYLDGTIYILSRVEGADECRIHAVDTRKWTCQPVHTTGTNPPGLDSVTAVLFEDQWLLFGGTDGDSKLNTVYLLNLKKKLWSKLETHGAQISPREGHVAVLLGQHMYVFGGNSELDGAEKYTNDLYRLDLVSHAWARVEPRRACSLPAPRYSHAAASWNDRLVVIGGDDANHYLNDVWVYDPSEAMWVEVQVDNAEEFTPRASMSATATPAGIVVFGGDSMDQGCYNDCFLLHLDVPSSSALQMTGHWIRLSPSGPCPSPRFVHAAAAVEDAVCITGGTGVGGEQVFDDLHMLRMRPILEEAIAESTPADLSETKAQQHRQSDASHHGGSRQGEEVVQHASPAHHAEQQLDTAPGQQQTAPPAASPSPQQLQHPPQQLASKQLKALARATDTAATAAAAAATVPASALLAGVTAPFAEPPSSGKGKVNKRGQPKAKGITSYNIFQNEMRPVLKKKNPHLDHRSIEGLISSHWGKLSDDEKAPYRQQANQHNQSVKHLLPERKRRKSMVASPSAASPGTDSQAAPSEVDAADALLGMDDSATEDFSKGVAGAGGASGSGVQEPPGNGAVPGRDQMGGTRSHTERATPHGGWHAGVAAGLTTAAAAPYQNAAGQGRPGGVALEPLPVAAAPPQQQMSLLAQRYREMQAQQFALHAPPPSQHAMPPISGSQVTGYQQRQSAANMIPAPNPHAPTLASATPRFQPAPPAPDTKVEVVNVAMYAVDRQKVGCKFEGMIDGTFGEGTCGGYTGIVEVQGIKYRAILTSPFLTLQPPQ